MVAAIAAPHAPQSCPKQYTQAQHRQYAVAVYSRSALTRRAQRRVMVLRTCQHSERARVNAKRLTRRLRHRYKARKIAAVTDWAIPAYVVMCESGGNFKAVNTSNPNRPAGAYQIITSTWLAHGGGRYAPTADRATPAQQHEIAGRIWASGGASQWACS